MRSLLIWLPRGGTDLGGLAGGLGAALCGHICTAFCATAETKVSSYRRISNFRAMVPKGKDIIFQPRQ
jgi:uncharacterized membrane protein YccF (DUF307 family)